jgi:serine kinase of HPr protein (carbohydrate metabolism regulator)
MAPTIHASAVLVGARGLLIRGPAGAGKSNLVLEVLAAAQAGLLPFARLVADDRVDLAAVHGRLIARPPPELAGLIEVRGLGIRRLAYEPTAIVTLVFDLADPAAERLPNPAAGETMVEGIILPRLAVPAGVSPLPIVAAAFVLERSGW